MGAREAVERELVQEAEDVWGPAVCRCRRRAGDALQDGHGALAQPPAEDLARGVCGEDLERDVALVSLFPKYMFLQKGEF